MCVWVCVFSLLPDGFHSAGKSPLGWFVVTFSITVPQCSAASCRPEEAVQDVFTAQRRNTKEQQQRLTPDQPSQASSVNRHQRSATTEEKKLK